MGATYSWSLLLCGFFLPPFIPPFPILPLTLDRKEERIEGREIPEFIFFFVHDNLQTVTILLKWPANTYPTSPGPSIYLPFEKFPESKYHTVIETICSWQNHASARAWGKSQSAAADSRKQPHTAHLGLKWKNILIFLWFFKETKISELSLQPHA